MLRPHIFAPVSISSYFHETAFAIWLTSVHPILKSPFGRWSLLIFITLNVIYVFVYLFYDFCSLNSNALWWGIIKSRKHPLYLEIKNRLEITKTIRKNRMHHRHYSIKLISGSNSCWNDTGLASFQNVCNTEAICAGKRCWEGCGLAHDSWTFRRRGPVTGGL